MPAAGQVKWTLGLKAIHHLADRVYVALEDAILSGQIKLGREAAGERYCGKALGQPRATARGAPPAAFRRVWRRRFQGAVPMSSSRRGRILSIFSRFAKSSNVSPPRLAAEFISERELKHLSDGLERIGKLLARNRKPVIRITISTSIRPLFMPLAMAKCCR